MTPFEALTKCGKLLHGRDWIRKTASTLNVSPITLNRWRSGKTPSFDANHSVFPVAIYKMREQAGELMRLADEIENWHRVGGRDV